MTHGMAIELLTIICINAMIRVDSSIWNSSSYQSNAKGGKSTPILYLIPQNPSLSYAF